MLSEVKERDIAVTCCDDCHFANYQIPACQHPALPNRYARCPSLEEGQVPDWCPLLEGPLTFTLKRN